jgi:hypothetical protein
VKSRRYRHKRSRRQARMQIQEDLDEDAAEVAAYWDELMAKLEPYDEMTWMLFGI